MDRHLYAYRQIDLDFDRASQVLAAERGTLLGEATDAAARGAKTMLHTTIAGMDVGREVTARLGPVRSLGMHTVSMAVAWEAIDGHGLFPRMLGNLEVTALSEHPPRSQVTFLGSYHPPAGVLGTALDAIAGKKVAESTIEHLLDEVCDRLVELAGDKSSSNP